MSKKIDKLKNQDDWDNWIGKQVVKYSKKPFKSGKTIGIPVEVTVNPHSNKKAFKMDDNSIVDCFQVALHEQEKAE